MSRPADLEAVALRLIEALGRERCLIVGGLAVAAHGYVRATDDVDLLSPLPAAEVVARLRRAGIAARKRPGDPGEGDFPCVRGTMAGIPFDVLPPLVQLRWDRAEEATLGGHRVNVVDLEGLLRLKMRAGGPQDLLDAAMLALLNPAHRASALQAAAAYGVEDRLRKLLADPRLRAKARPQRGRRRRRP